MERRAKQWCVELPMSRMQGPAHANDGWQSSHAHCTTPAIVTAARHGGVLGAAVTSEAHVTPAMLDLPHPLPPRASHAPHCYLFIPTVCTALDTAISGWDVHVRLTLYGFVWQGQHVRSLSAADSLSMPVWPWVAVLANRHRLQRGPGRQQAAPIRPRSSG